VGAHLLSVSLAFETVGGYTTKSDAWPVLHLTLQAAELHRSFPVTELYCLVTEALTSRVNNLLIFITHCNQFTTMSHKYEYKFVKCSLQIRGTNNMSEC